MNRRCQSEYDLSNPGSYTTSEDLGELQPLATKGLGNHDSQAFFLLLAAFDSSSVGVARLLLSTSSNHITTDIAIRLEL